MTDLERAQWALRGEPETWVNMIVMHLAAARREGYEEANKQTDAVIQGFAHRWMETGAADMRERAAELAEARLLLGLNIRASDIRALPLTPEDPP